MLFNRWGNWDKKQVTNMPSVTWLVSDAADHWPSLAPLQPLTAAPFLRLKLTNEGSLSQSEPLNVFLVQSTHSLKAFQVWVIKSVISLRIRTGGLLKKPVI